MAGPSLLDLSATHRIVSSGKCLNVIHHGNNAYTCSCSRGVFSYDIRTSSLQQHCQTCGHSPSEHTDTTDTQSSSRELRPSKELIMHEMVLQPSVNPIIHSRSDIISREATVAAFFTHLQAVRVIHVRGTPASGKTTLSLLLHDHILSIRPDLQVIWQNWGETGDINWFKWTHKEETVLIIDESQASYDDLRFWANFVKPVADKRNGPMIALFGSYGSPSQGPGRKITPMRFAIEQRMSIRPLKDGIQLSIFFTRQEFEDAIRLVRDQSGVGGQPFILSTGCIEHLWFYSNGHPGGIMALLTMLKDAPGLRKYRKDATEIPLEELKEILKDEHNLYRILSNTGFGRSFPNKGTIQDVVGLAKFFADVLIADCSKETPSTNKYLELCYHNGWLQAESISAEADSIVYVFPSRIHKGYLETILREESPPFPSHKYPTVKEFCFSAIRTFKRTSLASSPRGLGTSAIPKPLEAQYQDELYRAAYEILGGQIHLSSEWSPVGSTGRVDFRVRSMNWAIECVREGDRLQEHVARFQKGGIYHRWIQDGSIAEFIIIDFRTSMPPKVNFASPHLFFAVFDDDFRSGNIYDASGQKKDYFAVLA